MSEPQFERDVQHAYSDWLAGVARVPRLSLSGSIKPRGGLRLDPDAARKLLLDPRLAGMLRHFAAANSN